MSRSDQPVQHVTSFLALVRRERSVNTTVAVGEFPSCGQGDASRYLNGVLIRADLNMPAMFSDRLRITMRSGRFR